MLVEALIAVNDLGRLREIVTVLVRHGFDDLVQRTGLRRALARTGHALKMRPSPDVHEVDTATRARRALEELGPTFVKLGQLLASRPDLLPPEWTRELRKLHANVQAVPYDAIRAQLVEDLGMDPEQAFATFEVEPLAAGSIAQVHAATLKDGRAVVVKIRRPEISDRVASDLRLLLHVAEALEQEDGVLQRFRPVLVAKEFARTMRAELDLGIEARNIEAITRNMESVPRLVLPEVVAEFTDERVLVMSRLDGCTASDWLDDHSVSEVDPAGMARLGADVVMKMVFGDGLYHSDPHPGNIVFGPGGRLGLLDFGQVGRLSESRRRQLVRLLGAVVERDDDGVVDVLLDWSDDASPDFDALEADVRSFLDRYHGLPLEQLKIGRMLLDITELVRENDLVLPADVALLIKVFVTLEGVGRALDPGFELTAHVEPAARRLMREIASPRAVLRRNLRDLRSVLRHLPEDLRGLLTRARRGQFRIEMDLQRLERFARQVDRSANRITVGLITAALIIGTAIAMTIDRGPTVFGMPLLGFVGFVTSAAIGFGVLWSILRGRRI